MSNYQCYSRCYVDMDGVLTDFMSHVLDYIGLPREMYFKPGNWHIIKEVCDHLGWREHIFWSLLRADFWSSMSWTDEGEQILKLCEAHFEHVCILSSPANDASAKGKVQWAKKHVPQYWKTGRFYLGRNKQFVACPMAILVDDGDHNIDTFRSFGGIGVLVPRNWNSAHVAQHDCLNIVKHELLKSKSIIEKKKESWKKGIDYPKNGL